MGTFIISPKATKSVTNPTLTFETPKSPLITLLKLRIEVICYMDTFMFPEPISISVTLGVHYTLLMSSLVGVCLESVNFLVKVCYFIG
jgi:hypothetical protein